MTIFTIQKLNSRLLPTLFIILFISFFAHGQIIYGTTFYKISKEPFPFVTVQLIDSQNGNVLKTVETDLDGNFKFENIKKGKYNIKTFEITYGDSIIPLVVTKM